MKDWFPIWAAGFLDGEGCVAIHFFKDKTSVHGRRHVLRVDIGQCDLSILERMKDRWGGCICKHSKVKEKRRPFWRWECVGEAASDFLKEVEPYVIVKKPQVELALLFAKTMRLKGGRGRRLTEEDFSNREKYRLELKRLKRL